MSDRRLRKSTQVSALDEARRELGIYASPERVAARAVEVAARWARKESWDEAKRANAYDLLLRRLKGDYRP